MTVFKTFLKILNKNKFIILLYTIILIIFSGFNMQNSEKNINFIASKPDIIVVNYDKNEGITKGLIEYISDNSNIIKINNDKIDDSLFYREANYVIYIPKNYRKDFMNGKNPEIQIKSTGDYQASLAQMIVSRYIKVANIYLKSITDEDELIKKVDETLSPKIDVNILSKLDMTSLQKANFYFNFESYSLMACLIYVICLILSIFNNENIKKRTVISSTSYKKNNKVLLLSNCLYAFIIWLFYLLISFVLIGNIMFTIHGIIFMINSLVFTMCTTALAFFIGNLVQNKNIISGIVNVVALGSSFLCGAFVPQIWLPDFVLKIAHILPTYYYIKNNDMLIKLETINLESLKPLISNIGIMIIFLIVFIILANIVAKKRRKIG